MTLFTSKQFSWLVAIVFFCTIFAIVAIPALTVSRYNPNNLFHKNETIHAWIGLTYFNGDMDTINVTLSSPEIDILYLNGKGCIVIEKGMMVESLICGVREFKVLAKK